MSSSYSDYDSTGSDTDVPNDHVLEIDLDSLEAKNLVRRAAFSNLHSSGVRPAYEQYVITASVLSHPDNKEGEGPMIRIITRTNDSERATGDERWLHLGTECISFQEFKRYAANVALEHHADSLPVVMYLLDHVQDHHEQLSAYGSYIEPGTVLRCDGMDRHNRHKPDHFVTFISFPYFDTSHGSPFEPPEDASLHLTRSLFQQFYPHEVAKDRDDSQQFKKFRQTRGGEYLRVPQLWILILDSSTIVTCGPTSLKEMAQAWLEIIPEVSLASTTQKLVQVTDTRKRTTVLTPEQCDSYLELKRKIQDECLFDTKDDIDQCTIHVGDSELMLDPSHWPSLLRDTQSALINLVIRRRIAADTPPDDTLKFLDAPETRLMIEYTDLGSDDDSTSGRELILHSMSYRSPPKYPVPSGTRVESKKRLKAAGSVGIKDEALQQNDSAFFQGKQPKIFRRPTVAEDESNDGHTSVSSSSNARFENGSTSESHTGDSENDGSGSPIGAKHVRFRYAQSDEQWVTNSSAASRSVRTRDFDYISDGSEENTVAGAADSVSESSSTNYTTLVASNSALIKWTDPLRGIREAALESISKTVNEPYQARVDDYESSISSDGGSSLADQVEIFPLEPNGMRSRTSSLSQSGRLRDDEQVTGEGTHLGGSGTSVHDDDPSGPEDASTQSAPEEQTKPLTEHELRKVIQDVIGTTLRDNESQLEETMRTRLRKFGFQDNQIEAMISPGNEQPAGSGRPPCYSTLPTSSGSLGSQKPTKRILREVYLWKDELEIVEAVLEQQIETINAIKTVLNPDSFRITNQARIKAYRILEQPFAIQVKEQFEKVIRKELQALYKEADKLAESLRHNIDIAEEGNSKAILIFTLVTIIFLPLSFVSSVFGMNTIDVRDMESTQTLFWAVALPVTAVVGGLSMLAAYGGPTLHRYYKALKKVRLEIHPALKRPVRPNDEEKIIIAENDDAPEARTVRGRRRRSYIQVARGDWTRRSRARIPSPSPPPPPLRKPTQEGRNVTLGDMLFR
ncbi:hypothetical protein C7974DRAFT_427340 [Boeremia exigua]|uniref:uncharacterized protein n=1 Tax=Boeremia exigua TaxID=749465 RepID=UPI001E8E412A|nr:uncharacterized protein C7974DRAFT_427340 [Boeremia exigua]KAH6616338.1 hypothetical protein C7974DRAFT_427340 [Boeremia exigua]